MPSANSAATFSWIGTRPEKRGLGPNAVASALVNRSARAVAVSSMPSPGRSNADSHAPEAVSVRAEYSDSCAR